MFAGPAHGEKSRGVRPELFPARAAVDWRSQVEQARQNASDVRFNDWNGVVEREGRNRIRCVASDSGQLRGRSSGAGELAAVFVYDRNCSRPEIPGASVVPETLPRVEDVIFRGGGERCEIRETTQPFIVIRNDSSDLRL